METPPTLGGVCRWKQNIKFIFVNPLEGASQIDAVIQDLASLGLTPQMSPLNKIGKVSQEIIFRLGHGQLI